MRITRFFLCTTYTQRCFFNDIHFFFSLVGLFITHDVSNQSMFINRRVILSLMCVCVCADKPYRENIILNKIHSHIVQLPIFSRDCKELLHFFFERDFTRSLANALLSTYLSRAIQRIEWYSSWLQ